MVFVELLLIEVIFLVFLIGLLFFLDGLLVKVVCFEKGLLYLKFVDCLNVLGIEVLLRFGIVYCILVLVFLLLFLE